MNFNIVAKDKTSSARVGELMTGHGQIKTPVFMPVGTQGAVKSVHIPELSSDTNAQIILGNTYHLYLRPGINIIEQAGGLHKFNGWSSPILTDSGGYQVYSLSHKRKLTEEGITFQSHIDGSYHTFTPENVMDIQSNIGADIVMAFDECTPYPCEYDYAKNSMKITHQWLDRCIDSFKKTENKYGYPQTLFPIVQGSVYPDLRKQSAEFIASYNADGNAIGGLSVGEPHGMMYEMTDLVCSILPQEKPRYLMGVGTPENLLECIALGIDMFDCVMPTRNARHGLLYTMNGVINIKNEKWKNDFSVLDDEGDSFVDQQYSKAYLRHLFASGENLGAMIASLHNLRFYLKLMEMAREKITECVFGEWKSRILSKVNTRL